MIKKVYLDIIASSYKGLNFLNTTNIYRKSQTTIL
jgi:hypothetical protein